jgi:hypothetical protein
MAEERWQIEDQRSAQHDTRWQVCRVQTQQAPRLCQHLQLQVPHETTTGSALQVSAPSHENTFTGEEMLRYFEYPKEFKTLPDHQAHSGQIVEVGRVVNAEDAAADPQLEKVYEIRASDGWRGWAFSSELYTPNTDGTKLTLWEELDAPTGKAEASK